MKAGLFFFLLYLQQLVFAQDSLPKNNLTRLEWSPEHAAAKKKQTRQIIATSFQCGLITSSLLILNQYWYADYPKQSLASFNDSKEWMQMDKFGHVFSTYFEARTSAAI
jgi:hypothetical protein